MKGHINQLQSKADIVQINCDLYDAELTICTTDDELLAVTFPEAKNVQVALNNCDVFVNQGKHPLLCAKQRIIIQVPQHLVPNLNIYVKKSAVIINGGIYASLKFRADEGEFNAVNCAFAEANVIGSNCKVNIKDITVKSPLNLQVERGRLLLENVFAPRAELRLNKGNTGLINYSGKDCFIETLKGNVMATFSGDKKEYSVSVKTVMGTSNTNSFNNENANKCVKVFAEGNVMLDFIGVKEQVA